MSKKNYTNYGSPNKEIVNRGQRMETASIDETVDMENTEIESVVEESSVKNPTKPLVGIVNGCAKLRVRKTPSANAEVLGIIPTQSKVKVFTEGSTTDWYKVCTVEGYEGYCMKKFIVVK